MLLLTKWRLNLILTFFTFACQDMIFEGLKEGQSMTCQKDLKAIHQNTSISFILSAFFKFNKLKLPWKYWKSGLLSICHFISCHHSSRFYQKHYLLRFHNFLMVFGTTIIYVTDLSCNNLRFENFQLEFRASKLEIFKWLCKFKIVESKLLLEVTSWNFNFTIFLFADYYQHFYTVPDPCD